MMIQIHLDTFGGQYAELDAGSALASYQIPGD
jgi:hypothetical protein